MDEVLTFTKGGGRYIKMVFSWKQGGILCRSFPTALDNYKNDSVIITCDSEWDLYSNRWLYRDMSKNGKVVKKLHLHPSVPVSEGERFIKAWEEEYKGIDHSVFEKRGWKAQPLQAILKGELAVTTIEEEDITEV